MTKEKATVSEAAVEELPRTIVRRVVKEKLSDISGDGGDVNLHKEALLAFSESARIFIHYLSATAHDICSEAKRQIINADDVLKALDEIEFSEFIEPLEVGLVEFRKKAARKRAGSAKSKEVDKKMKTDKEISTENGEESKEVNEDNENKEEEEEDDNENKEEEDDNENKDEEEDNEDNENKDEEEASEDNENKDEEEDNEDNENIDEEEASEDKDDSNDS